MGRNKKYSSTKEKQRAYRLRKKQTMQGVTVDSSMHQIHLPSPQYPSVDEIKLLNEFFDTLNPNEYNAWLCSCEHKEDRQDYVFLLFNACEVCKDKRPIDDLTLEDLRVFQVKHSDELKKLKFVIDKYNEWLKYKVMS